MLYCCSRSTDVEDSVIGGKLTRSLVGVLTDYHYSKQLARCLTETVCGQPSSGPVLLDTTLDLQIDRGK